MSAIAANAWYWVTYPLPFLFVLAVVVIVHELGHFLVARFFGVTVETFSIGFGKEITSRYDRYGTKWRLAWLPLGGYVKFKGDENAASMPAPEDLAALSPEDRAGNFHAKPLIQRAAVVAAGPVANMILALVILSVLFMSAGKEIVDPRVVAVEPGSAADIAGIKPDDLILKAGGNDVESISDVERTVMKNNDTAVPFLVDRGGRQIVLNVTPLAAQRELMGEVVQVGRLGVAWMPPRVASIEPGSAAEQAGLQPGDLIVQMDGKPIASFEAVQAVIKDSPDKAIQVVLERDGRKITLSVTPQSKDVKDKKSGAVLRKVGRLGVGAEQPTTMKRFGPIEAVARGAAETYGWTRDTFSFIGQLVTGKTSSDQVGSFIRIAKVSHQTVSTGVMEFFFFIAFISVQIGLFNLFPIPVLDGGHLLFYGIEAIRGRPLSERTMDIGFRIGITLMIMLMLFAMRNDLIH